MLRQIVALVYIPFLLSCNNDNTNHIIGKLKLINTSPRILTYGLLDSERQRALNTVANRYGFHYYPVAGCIVSNQLLDSIHVENKKVYLSLAQRFGKNWKINFEEEVDTIQKLQRQVEDLVAKEPYIITTNDELEKDGDDLDFLIDPTKKKNEFIVTAYTWGQQNKEIELLIYYKLVVDLSTKTIINPATIKK